MSDDNESCPDKIDGILLFEIRENRKEIKGVREDVSELRQKLSHLKMKVYAMALFLGSISSEFKAYMLKVFK